MPLYEYRCARGHHSDQWRALAARDEPASCASCGAVATRAVSAPRLAVLSPATRFAHERNERSAHEPRVMRAPAGGACASSGRHGHEPGHRPQPQRPHRGRPWMLGH